MMVSASLAAASLAVGSTAISSTLFDLPVLGGALILSQTAGLGAVVAHAQELDIDSFGSLGDDEDEPEAFPEPESVPPLQETELRKVPFQPPTTPAHASFVDTFQHTGKDPTEAGWVLSSLVDGEWELDTHPKDLIIGDKALKVKSQKKYHAISRQLSKPFDPANEEALYASMEVQYESDVNCGGAYIKLFNSKDAGAEGYEGLRRLDGKTPYSIMFGPDRCGYNTNKVHLIIKYDHPKQPSQLVEAHASNVPRLPEDLKHLSHQYGFKLTKDGQYAVYVDGVETSSGKIVDDFKNDGANSIGFKNGEEIDDPNDKKPEDWDDRKQIEDPDAVKPDDWDESAPAEVPDMDAVMPDGWEPDEPLSIPNPAAEKPETWNDEEDGEWIRPTMKNPKCKIGCGPWTRPMKANPAFKGPWSAPLIDNPNYKGVWAPRKIPNPLHFEVTDPWKVIRPFDALGLELWVVETGATFDNFLVTTSSEEYHNFVKETWKAKHEIEAENVKRQAAAEKRQMESKTETPSMWSHVVKAVTSDYRASMMLAAAVPTLAIGYMLNKRMTKRTRLDADAARKKDDDKEQEKKAEPEKKSSGKRDEDKKEGDSKKDKTDNEAETSKEDAGARKRKGSQGAN